ncbi:histone deacetylase 15-like [Nymphaea colorata]|uniref:histone deacetylase 15-like n=1 Tax=Nymphaea colorata TaxID=210225 RepID=UPI00129E3D99|nr:histone deacetylase 15-like [Nymphaea colorata]
MKQILKMNIVKMNKEIEIPQEIKYQEELTKEYTLQRIIFQEKIFEQIEQQEIDISKEKIGTAACGVCSRNGSVNGHPGENPNSDILTAVSTQSRLQRRAHGDGPLQDLVSLYHQQDQPEDDDDEPHLQHAVSEKWFCINCTMPNFDDVLHCDFCGEIQESEILIKGSFASTVTREGFLDDAEAIAGHLEPCIECLPSKDCTLVGFNDRMLLHSEVEQKSHPHPERPDRLRAIAASFAVVGIFPVRCFPIPAREGSLAELGLIHSMEHVNAVKATSYMLSRHIFLVLFMYTLAFNVLSLLLCVATTTLDDVALLVV